MAINSYASHADAPQQQRRVEKAAPQAPYTTRRVNDLQGRVEKLMVNVLALHCDLRQSVHKKIQTQECSGSGDFSPNAGATEPAAGGATVAAVKEFDVEQDCCNKLEAETPGPVVERGGVSIDASITACPESVRCSAHGMWRSPDGMVMTASGEWICALGCRCGTASTAHRPDAEGGAASAAAPTAAAAAAAPSPGGDLALKRLVSRRAALAEDCTAHMSEGLADGSSPGATDQTDTPLSSGGPQRRAVLTEHIRAIMAEAWALVSEDNRSPQAAGSATPSQGNSGAADFMDGMQAYAGTQHLSQNKSLDVSPLAAVTEGCAKRREALAKRIRQSLSEIGAAAERSRSNSEADGIEADDVTSRMPTLEESARILQIAQEEAYSTSAGSYHDSSDSSSNDGSDVTIGDLVHGYPAMLHTKPIDAFLVERLLGNDTAATRRACGSDSEGESSTSSHVTIASEFGSGSQQRQLPPFRLPEQLVEDLAASGPAQKTQAAQLVLDAQRQQKLEHLRHMLVGVIECGRPDC